MVRANGVQVIPFHRSVFAYNKHRVPVGFSKRKVSGNIRHPKNEPSMAYVWSMEYFFKQEMMDWEMMDLHINDAGQCMLKLPSFKQYYWFGQLLKSHSFDSFMLLFDYTANFAIYPEVQENLYFIFYTSR